MMGAQREQWDDGLQLPRARTGVVVGYERNTTTNMFLRENGIEVVEIVGSNSAAVAVAPRCMSCPIEREAV